MSYTWGDAESLHHQVKISGKLFPVRQNLYDFLLQWYQYRHNAPKSEWLFIDQMCIHQRDDAERSHQVNFMSTIYPQAQMVIVWLGAQCRTSVQLKNYLTNVGTDASSNALEIMQELAHHPYFTRLWIVQEILLARQVHVLWGDCQFSWGILGSLYVKSGY